MANPMTNEDLLQCPLLQALDPMRRAELLGLLKDSNLREKVEQCLAGRPPAQQPPAKSMCAELGQPRDFQKDVRSWNTAVPMWQRSPKE